MKIDLKDMNRKELEKLQSDVEKALKRVTDREKKEAREALKKTAASYGYTPEEILDMGGASKPKTTRTKKPAKPGKPKYRNPANADETWTGKGRPPKWFTEATKAGKSRESMEIKG